MIRLTTSNNTIVLFSSITTSFTRLMDSMEFQLLDLSVKSMFIVKLLTCEFIYQFINYNFFFFLSNVPTVLFTDES